METFSALLAIWAGNSPVSGEFSAQRPVTRSFDVFFDLCPNKRLSKQSWGWWFETPSGSLWRHSNYKVISHWGRVRIQDHHWSTYWPVAYQAPRHRLNKCRLVANVFQWNFYKDTPFSFEKMHLKCFLQMSVNLLHDDRHSVSLHDGFWRPATPFTDMD